MTKTRTFVPVLPENALRISLHDGLVWSQDGKYVVTGYFDETLEKEIWIRIPVANP